MNKVVIFEISSEAARKIGGIYTVIKTKSKYIQKFYPNSYYYIGYYDERCTKEVKLIEPPKEIKKVFDELAKEGIYCYYGLWMAANNCPIILVDAKAYAYKNITYTKDGQVQHDLQVNYIKYVLWKEFTIDSLMEKSWDFTENVGWGWAVGMLIEKLLQLEMFKNNYVIGQFHEWISGAALLYCKYKKLPLASVFTTHATVLGRTMSASGIDVISLALNSISPISGSKAYEFKVEGKHQLEVQAAKKADVFTTVSEVVAQEVRYILGRYPDVITINGIDIEEIEHEAQIKNLSEYVRAELLQLSEAVFIPYFNARYDNALLTFISGRYEFKNKGFDIFIKGLSRLNKKIIQRGQYKQKQVIAFIFTPSSISGPKISVIKNYLLIDKISEVIDAMPKLSSKKHYPNIIQRIEDIKNENFYYDLKDMAKNFVKESKDPPISLYDLNYPNDEIVLTCLKEGLTNKETNPVKVLFYPTYLNTNDGLMNMSYNDVITGMDVGVFPSRYEPFGYTPLEAAAKYNIAVSTNRTGFGKYLLSLGRQNDLKKSGIEVLNIEQEEEKIYQDLANFFEDLYYSEPEQLFERKEAAYKTAHVFDWKELIKNYLKAYELALNELNKKLIQKDIQSFEEYKYSSPLVIAKERMAYVLSQQEKEESESKKQKGKNKKNKN